MRLIPGLPLQCSLRGLVVSAPGSSHRVGVLEGGTGRRLDAVARASRAPSTPMAAALRARGIWPYPFVVEGLKPDVEYAWIVDGRRVGAPIRTLPRALPPQGATIVAATCLYGYFEGAAAHVSAMRTVVQRERALFRVLAGDNVYLDVAPEQQSFSDGYAETAARYAHYFVHGACADALPLVGTCTTWDDHEFWNDYPETQPYLSRTWEAHYDTYRSAADEAIELFQMPLNPPPVEPGMRCYAFDLAPLHFFVADSRTRRTRADAPGAGFMPERELAALERWLMDVSMDGPRVLVLGQPLWTPESFSMRLDHNLPYFQNHYRRLLDALRESLFDTLVITGDVHFSRLLTLEFPRGRRVYELVTSPACHVPTLVSGAVHALLPSVDFAQDHTAPTLDGPPVRSANEPRPTAWHFATGASHTFGVLRFKPLGRLSVSVGGGFVDGARPDAPWLPAARSPDHTIDRLPTSVCASDQLFTLGDR